MPYLPNELVGFFQRNSLWVTSCIYRVFRLEYCENYMLDVFKSYLQLDTKLGLNDFFTFEAKIS